MIRLGVNIDHVATVRQARLGVEPEPAAAAVLALLGGADGITIHLREDRRHIQDRDLALLRQLVPTRLNLEMACVDAIAELAGTVTGQGAKNSALKLMAATLLKVLPTIVLFFVARRYFIQGIVISGVKG